MEPTRNLLRYSRAQLHELLLVQFRLKVPHELLEDDHAARLGRGVIEKLEQLERELVP